MQSTARPRRRTDVSTEALPDGSAVLFDPRNYMAYPVTSSAALVWEACDGAHTVSSLVDRVSAVYDAAADVIAGDVATFLRDLEEKGLLEPAEEAGE